MWPIWLLDIDGVINGNPYRRGHNLWGGEADSWIETNAMGGNRWWPLTTAIPVVNFIRRVHDEKWAEIVWLTTWQTDANNVSAALGLPHFRVLTNPMQKWTRYHDSADWWKLAEALKESQTGRSVVWTDDDLSRTVKNLFYDQCPAPSLLISPHGDEGLAPKHLVRIAAFLNMPYDPE